MMIEQVILVDKNDHEVGIEEKLAAHQKGLCHRAFSIFIFDNRTEPKRMLLQQRHHDKYHSGGLWSNACCGHPRPGESISAAASRRLKEELGISVPLSEVGVLHYRAELDHGLIEDEIDHLFIGEYHGEMILPHPDEISQIDWATLESLQQSLMHNQDSYTVWLAPGLAKMRRCLVKAKSPIK